MEEYIVKEECIVEDFVQENWKIYLVEGNMEECIVEDYIQENW